jgi:UDP-3-O-[3-hydroxymyristoyl] glucosamine N-acyltransferase
MDRTLQQVADAIGATVRGDSAVLVRGVASVRRATSGDIVFVEDARYIEDAIDSPASAVITGSLPADLSSKKPILVAPHPKLAFARAAQFLSVAAQASSNPSRVHHRATVHASARLGEGVIVGEHAVVGESAELGPHSILGAGCVIGAGVRIGRECRFYPNVTVYPGTVIGDRVIVHAGAVLGSDGFGYVRDGATGNYEKFPQIGQLIIEDDVEIGANTTIDRGALEVTRIGRGSKLDNLVHIGHNCQIGQNVVIAAQTGLSGSIVIEDNVVLGGQVGIGEHARVEEGVMLGGQGGVLPHKVLRGKGEVFWGTPAQPVREYLKQLGRLARLGKK